jgi:hypothetical protein
MPASFLADARIVFLQTVVLDYIMHVLPVLIFILVHQPNLSLNLAALFQAFSDTTNKI